MEIPPDSKTEGATRVGATPDLGPGYVDAHCHFADPRLDESRAGRVAGARAAGFTAFVQAGVDPADWARQLELARLYPEIIPVFGLHPYAVNGAFVSGQTENCETALDQLARLLPQSPLLGETGLDLRPPYRESEGFQIEMFETQLQMAEMAGKPVLLHLVRAFDEASRVFQLRGAPRFGGFVHAFGGGLKEARYYTELGLLLSVGAALLNPKNQKLRAAVKELDIRHFLLESDAPDQPPFDAPAGTLNSSEMLLRAAEEFARLKGMTAVEVLATSKANLERLFRRNTP